MSLSVKALRAARTALDGNADYRKLGSADVNVCLRAGGKYYGVTFHAFRISDVKTIDAHRARDVDFTIELADWDAYLKDRAAGRGRSLMEMDLTEDVVRCPTPRARVEFMRYHLSIQAFVDAAAQAA